jgi:geranylgeranyl diphosphate synthase type I
MSVPAGQGDGRGIVNSGTPTVIARARELVEPALRAAINGLDPHMAVVSAYQLGWVDTEGAPTPGGGGKAIRPTLAVVSAESVGAEARVGVPAAAAVELVHNFSLLHDDVMDRDVERRHRPTGWKVFGEGQAILGGSAMMTRAIEVLVADGEAGARALPVLLRAVQALIRGQSADLRFEQAEVISLTDCIDMEAGKTAALLECAASIGAVAAGAPAATVRALAGYGFELGVAFQLVDDVLGIDGDPLVTGKSASSDLRAGKRSAPVVAALNSDTPAAQRLAKLLAGGPPATECDVLDAKDAVIEAGGLDWANAEAQRRFDAGLAHLDAVELDSAARDQLVELAEYVVKRNR